MNGIFQAQTGFPLTVTEPVDVALTSLTNRPERRPAIRTTARRRRSTQWFNTRCFARLTLAANAGQIGNAGRNTVRGPGFARTDLSLFKNIALPRQQQIQLRVEAFNLFNQDRASASRAAASARRPSAQITSADDGRIVQLGVKWGWR